MLPAETAYGRRHFQTLVDEARLDRDVRVLEIGAGMGRFTRMFAEAGFDVAATDISAGQIETLRRHVPGVEAFVADAATLPDPVVPYDAVVGFFMLHHLPDLRTAFARFAHVVRPGGLVAFCEPNAFYVPFYAQILLTPRMRWSVDKGVRDMRRGVIEPALRAARFDDVRFSHYGFFPPFLYNRPLGRRVEAALEALPVPGIAKAFQIVTARRARD